MITLTTGTAFIMWLGEQITERGIGNGISLIIFAGIVTQLPVGGLHHARDGPRRRDVRVRRRAAGRALAWSWWRPSSSWSAASGASRSSTPSGWSGVACTAGRAPTCRSRSTRRASSRPSSRRRCCSSRRRSCSSSASESGRGRVQRMDQPRRAGLQHRLRRPHHLLLLLLHGGHVQSGRRRGQPEEGRRATSRAFGPGSGPPSTSTGCWCASRYPGALYVAAICVLPTILSRQRPGRALLLRRARRY